MLLHSAEIMELSRGIQKFKSYKQKRQLVPI